MKAKLFDPPSATVAGYVRNVHFLIIAALVAGNLILFAATGHFDIDIDILLIASRSGSAIISAVASNGFRKAERRP